MIVFFTTFWVTSNMLKCLSVWTHLCVCPDQFICGKAVVNTLCWPRSPSLVSRTHSQKHSQPPCSSLQRGPFKSPHMLLSKHVTLYTHIRAPAHAQAKLGSMCAIMYVQEEHAHQSAQRPHNLWIFFFFVSLSDISWTWKQRGMSLVCRLPQSSGRFRVGGNSQLLKTVWELTCKCYLGAWVQWGLRPFVLV